ncbi:unnamed protein product [Lactuca saligna]|uniref:Myb-like domain-containing protein n=1 Tax=Lactuca saligna TaxID=75948 RepID=A0AA35ZZC5_LACSI|nr:unnamed protein product [Lactuca saligna]
MLQGPPGLIGNSGDVATPAQPPQQPVQAHGSVAVELGGGFSEEETGGRIEGERSGNGWPRKETLALIQIRSEMDFAFRDASAKGPLWDEVSRKLGELGYHRSGKKCKEKFENVYKYHKRTKEGRTSKADGKTYRFFDQLEALEANTQRPPAGMTTTTTSQHPFSQPSVVIPFNVTGSHSHQTNVSPISVAAPAMVNHGGTGSGAGAFPFSSSNTTSSSTSSDEEPPELRRKRKRKWKDFFGRLMTEVIHKQEELQMKFLDQIERRERDRMAREEAWRIEEMAKMNREHELLVQERSIAAAKDAAVITFLQKITEQNSNNPVTQISQQPPPQQQKQQNLQPVQTPPPPPPPQTPTPPPAQQQHQVQPPVLPATPLVKNLDNGGGGKSNIILAPSPSRWPKTEVYALIKLRTTLDMKYQDSGPKGPLWEEISAGMIKLGYNRNAKRCKEKWENINKYYKKVKESSKKRPEDSKTCPYFHQLDAIYRERANNSSHSSLRLPETTQMEPIMAEPEQQWPLPAAVVQQQQPTIHQNNEDDYDDEDEDDEDEGGDYEIAPNNNSSSVATVTMAET